MQEIAYIRFVKIDIYNNIIHVWLVQPQEKVYQVAVDFSWPNAVLGNESVSVSTYQLISLLAK